MLIELKKVKKEYQIGNQTVLALNGIDLGIEKGEFVALMGPSGSGKSTLMNIIGCLDTPSYGHYFLNGTDVGIMNDENLSRVRNKQIGFVFQSFNLLSRYNSLENVMLPLIYGGLERKERESLAVEALEMVGLLERIDHKPSELSGGQRQRVALARALVTKPSLLLADEPTGNLDSKTSHEIMDLLHNLHQKGNTIILVTHEEDIAQFAKRMVRLRDGIIESDQKS